MLTAYYTVLENTRPLGGFFGVPKVYSSVKNSDENNRIRFSLK